MSYLLSLMASLMIELSVGMALAVAGPQLDLRALISSSGFLSHYPESLNWPPRGVWGSLQFWWKTIILQAVGTPASHEWLWRVPGLCPFFQPLPSLVARLRRPRRKIPNGLSFYIHRWCLLNSTYCIGKFKLQRFALEVQNIHRFPPFKR